MTSASTRWLSRAVAFCITPANPTDRAVLSCSSVSSRRRSAEEEERDRSFPLSFGARFFHPGCMRLRRDGMRAGSLAHAARESLRVPAAHASLYLRLGGGSTERVAITISGHYDRMGSVQRCTTVDELTDQAVGTVYHCGPACAALANRSVTPVLSLSLSVSTRSNASTPRCPFHLPGLADPLPSLDPLPPSL